MAKQTKPTDWQIFVFVGMSDFAVGVGLLIAGLTGMLGENSMLFAVIGGVMAVAGAGIAIWTRNKMSQGSGPGGRQD